MLFHQPATTGAYVTSRDTVIITIITSLTTLLVAIVGAVVALRAKQRAAGAEEQARQANDAVNHRHPDSANPRIYDAVLELRNGLDELRDWRAQWDKLPRNLADADGLTDTLAQITRDVADLRHLVVEHVDWEQNPSTGKYAITHKAPPDS